MSGMNAKKVKNTGGGMKQPPLEAGTYPSRVAQVICLGLQAQQPYKGEPKDPKIDIRMTYELSDEFIVDAEGNEDQDKPRWISEDFPLNSLDSDLAKSTKRYYALDPSVDHGGDFAKLVGSPCMLTLSKTPDRKDKDKFYNNVVSVQTMRSKDAEKAPDLKNESKVFDFYNPDIEVFLSLPTWLQEKIKEALDFGGSELEALISSTPKTEEKEEPKKSKPEIKEEEGTDEDW